VNPRATSHSDLEEIKNTSAQVLAENTDLSIYGWHGNPSFEQTHFARYSPDPKWSYKDRRSPSDISKIDYDNVRTALRFIETQCCPQKTFNKKRGSYGLKHDAEAWGKENGMSSYVANGEFILAAILAGFDFKREKRANPNCLFNIAFLKKST
jgi:hypothetical protein